MKVDRSPPPSSKSRGRPDDFKRTLEQALRPGPKASPQKLSRPPTAQALRGIASPNARVLALPERLGQVRTAMHREADRLDVVAASTREERRDGELERGQALERISERDPSRQTPPSSSERPEPLRADAQSAKHELFRTEGAIASPPRIAASQTSEGPVSIQTARELVERIEAFVKSQRPGLALTLRGALDGRVEIERVGPNEVALSLKARSGEVPLGQMARVRDELISRGLKVRQLRVG